MQLQYRAESRARLGVEIDKISGLNWSWFVLFVLGGYKNKIKKLEKTE